METDQMTCPQPCYELVANQEFATNSGPVYKSSVQTVRWHQFQM